MNSSQFCVVNVENGPVRGLKTKNIFGSEYCSFRGVPYMKPPLGKLRFREAESAENWIEPFDATQEGPSYCMTDFMTGLQDGQENSGTINIYTKNLDPAEYLPVMIWVSFFIEKKFFFVRTRDVKRIEFRFTEVAIAEDLAERICSVPITL